MTEAAFDGSILWGMAGLVFALAILVVVVSAAIAVTYAYLHGKLSFGWLTSAYNFIAQLWTSKK